MQKEITIYDLARELNLSPATVSRGLKNHQAINKNTKKRITDKAEEMGYRFNTFASNLRKSKTNTIGVIVPRLNSYFVSTVLAAMEKIASEAGYNIIISQSIESMSKEEVNAKTMFDNRVDGLLVSLAYDTINIDHFQRFLKRNIPIIFFDRVHERDDCVSIVIDNYKNGYEITKHLIEQGCRNIVHITGSLKRNVYGERFKGYQDALKDGGLAFNDDLLIINELNEAAGAQAAEQILAMKPLPDAVFVTHDGCAASCMRVLKINGIRVPEDIAIAGFNNDPISRIVEPNITTINYPAYQMGEIAATHLINRLKNVADINATNKIILKSELLIRESSLKKKS
jgi:LacI family transcriptional regulator